MAERKRMTCGQVVGYLLEGEGLDFLRESLAWVVQQLMEAEVSEVGRRRPWRAGARERHPPQRVVESLGLRLSKSEVSRICQRLDEQVDAFRNRPLAGRYPYLWLDAKMEKVRDGGRVVSASPTLGAITSR